MELENVERATGKIIALVQEAMSEIPETTSIWRRPVYERLLKRKHLMPLAPPTRREYEDALLVLSTFADDELQDEALLILEERK